MPVITVTLGQNQATTEQKKALVNTFTEHAVKITSIPEEKFTILINELPTENIGVGGKTLTELQQAKG